MAKKVTNNTCPIFIETTNVDILIYSDYPTHTIQEPQSGVFCIPNYPILSQIKIVDIFEFCYIAYDSFTFRPNMGLIN